MSSESRVAKITKTAVDAAEPASAMYRVWDSELKGFGLKVMPSGVKTYMVRYRAGQGRRAAQREYTIARHGEMTPAEAREEAAKVLGRVRLGDDPQQSRHRARSDLTVSELCDLYLAQGTATKKPSTIATDRHRINAHIKPLLGKRPASAVRSADVSRFLREVAAGKTAAPPKLTRKAAREQGLKVSALDPSALRRRTDAAARGGKGTATRTLGLLGSIFAFAVREGLRADNPVHGVERFKHNRCQRFLSADELSRLAKALNEAEGEGANSAGLNVIRLLALTGSRKGEIEGLKWSEVDFDRALLRLADSKTGARVVPLGAAALALLAKLQRHEGSPYVFPAQASDAAGAKPAASSPRHYVGTAKIWGRVTAAAGLDGVRLHDLRHTFASFGAAGGLSLPLIAAMLGHRDVKTTQQYAHLADSPVKVAADRTAAAIAGAMAGQEASVRVLRKR